MLLRILHRTRYRYHGSIDMAQHMVHLSPKDTATQQLIEHSLRIQPEPANGLKGYLARQLGIITEIEETACFRSRCTIFRKVTACLSHEPDGRWCDRFPIQNVEDFSVRRAQGSSPFNKEKRY